MYNKRPPGGWLAGEQTVEAPQRPRHSHAAELKFRIWGELEAENDRWTGDAEYLAYMPNLSFIAVAPDIENSSDLMVGEAITIDVENKFEYIARCTTDRRTPFPTDASTHLIVSAQTDASWKQQVSESERL